MPYKSAQRQNRMLGGFSVATGIICIIFLMVFSWIGLETWEAWTQQMETVNARSLQCLKQFEAKKCNPFQLTQDCKEIKVCILKQGNIFDKDNISILVQLLNSSIANKAGGITLILVFLTLYQFRRAQII